MKRLLSIGLTAFLVAMLSGAWAQAPRTISYQGVLTDGSGTPVADGNYNITFRLYDVSSGGTAIWTEAQSSVPVAGGIFNTTLGSVVALTAAFDATYWLTVSVAGGPETSPRREFTSVPYAINAYAVQGSTNVFPANGNAGVGTTSPSAPLVVHFDNLDSSAPAIAIDNNTPGGQDVIDFLNSGKPGARIRYAAGGGLSVGTVSGQDLLFRTGDTNRMTIGPTGDVLIGGAPAPVEKLDIEGAIRLGTTSNSNAGTMRWTGADFEGYDGATWKSLTGGASGTLPVGSASQTLRHDGVNWVATDFLFNTGSMLGIGTTTPSTKLHIAQDIDDAVGITIENTDLGSNSMERLDFRNEDGALAAIVAYDDDHIHAGQLRMFNNRPGGTLTLLAGGSGIAVANGGAVGIRTKSPEAALHVAGGQSDLDLSEGDFKIGDTTNRLKFGVGTSGPGMGTSSIRAAGSIDSKLVLGAGSADVVSIDEFGVVDVGSSTQDGELDVFRNGIAGPVVMASGTGDGGKLYVFDEAGNMVTRMEPDADGEGGRFTVQRTGTSVGFFVEGNDNGNGDPTGGWVGASRSAQFRMLSPGDNSVMFPVDAISSTEMLDEPGVASETRDATVSLNGGVETVLTRSITAPSAGFALVTGTFEIRVSHTNGAFSSATFGVSDNAAAFPANQDVGFQIPSVAPTGTYTQPVTVHGLFEVAGAGVQSFYLLAEEFNGMFNVDEVQFTVVFLPTAYGTVTPTFVGAGGDSHRGASALSPSDLAAERAEAAAFHRERVDRELAAMRAELEALKQELGERD